MKNIFIHETAEVNKKAKIGENTKIWNQVQIRENAVIGENCNIGKNAYIDINVKIGNNVKLQTNVNICNGVTIEDDVFIGPHITFTNDLLPRSFNQNWELVETKVKKGASLCATAVIVCGTTINEYAMVGAGAVVTKDVPPYALVVGNPARIIGYVCKCGRRVEQQGESCAACTISADNSSAKEAVSD